MNPAKIEDIYPLAPMQEGMLFHSLYSEEAEPPILQWTARIDAPLDAAAFEDAWRRVVERHPILRTGFVLEEAEEPVQIVLRSVDLPWAFEDIRPLSAEEQTARVETILEQDRLAPFDIADAPLMRLRLLRTGDSSHLFVWTFHLLLLDGWSTSLVLNEVFSIYESLRDGQTVDLPPARRYRDLIAWHREQGSEPAEKFWRGALAGISAPTEIGIARRVASREGVRRDYGEETVLLPPEETAGIQSFAQEHRLTLSTLARATWALLLSRYGDADRVVFGVTMAGRPGALRGVESIAGLFINTLPVRVDVPEDESVVGWLTRLQNEQAELLDHQFSRLVDVQSWSEIPRGTPLFESILAVQTYPVEDALRIRQRRLRVTAQSGYERTNYPLTIKVSPGDQLAIGAYFEEGRFDRADIHRMLRHMRTLLTRMREAPSAPLSSISCMDADELQTVLVDWNSTEADFPRDRTLHGLFEARALEDPAAAAVEDDGGSLTYGQLNERAGAVAGRLRQRGVGPEAVVGICFERSRDMVVGLLAILKAGGAYLPIDPAYPPARAKFMLQDAGARVVVTRGELLQDLEASIERVRVDHEGDAPSDAAGAAVGATAKSLAYVIYTSGSTGTPKGVAVEHESAVNLAAWHCRAYALTPADRGTLLASPSFDASVWELWPYLASGASLHVPDEETRMSPVRLSRWLEQKRITVSFVPTPLAQAMLDESEPPSGELRFLLTGGDQLRRPPARPLSFALVNHYGPTETTVVATAGPVDLMAEDAEAPSIGRPISNTRVYIVDRRGLPVPAGIPGEIFIGGVGVAREYLGRPGLTAEKFVPDPYGPDGGRLYRTGDRGRFLAGGEIQFLGRLDQQVKIRGFRIETGEIEEALNGLPGVARCAVLARDDDGNRRLVAYVVPSSAEATSASALREGLQVSLPEYMVPAVFVFLAELPLTPNGKIDRRALPAPAAASAGAAQPRTPVQEVLVGIWSQLLGRDRIGIDDNFFQLGGHSLLATQVFSRVRDYFHVTLPLRYLFEGPTIAELAPRIEAARQTELGNQPPPLEAVSKGGEIPLSFAQQRLWFLDQLDPGASSYNSRRALRLRGALDPAALEGALFAMTARHESLRTTFENREGRAVQLVHAAERVPLGVRDLAEVRPSDRERDALRLVNQEASRPFDLRTGPLFRAILFRLGPEDHILLLVVHHIVCDGWSMGILSSELSALYGAFVRGEPSPLSSLPIQYADFAVWERNWMEGEVLERQLFYWTGVLRDSSPVLDLRGDRPRPRARVGKGARLSFDIPVGLSEELAGLGRREGSTLYMTLLAALGVLLSHQTGSEDVVVGSPVAGRNRIETEGVVGLFINTIVLRLRLEGNPSFRELMQRVRETALGAYTHQEVPFERLVDALKVERTLSHNPVFQVWFVLQNSGGPPPELAGLSVEDVALETEAIRHDLQLSAEETSSGLNIQWDYATDIFDFSTIERLSDRFEVLLTRILERPDAPLSTLRDSTDDEVRDRQQRRRQKAEMDSVLRLKESRRKAVRL
ncbi:MAG: amino acid adenylation domain-containing protein [Thermoanaerobaculia bacterium]